MPCSCGPCGGPALWVANLLARYWLLLWSVCDIVGQPEMARATSWTSPPIAVEAAWLQQYIDVPPVYFYWTKTIFQLNGSVGLSPLPLPLRGTLQVWQAKQDLCDHLSSQDIYGWSNLAAGVCPDLTDR